MVTATIVTTNVIIIIIIIITTTRSHFGSSATAVAEWLQRHCGGHAFSRWPRSIAAMGKRAASSQDAGEEAPERATPPSRGRGRGRSSKATDEFQQSRLCTKADISNFITPMKYVSGESSRAPPDKKQEAAEALTRYNSLNPQEKQAWVAKWLKNKKDLSWTTQVTSGRELSAGAQKQVIRGMMNRFEVFELNKIPQSLQSGPGSDELLMDLIKKSEAEFQYEGRIVAHSNPMLTTYLYCKRAADAEVQHDMRKEGHTDTIEGLGSKDAAASDS